MGSPRVDTSRAVCGLRGLLPAALLSAAALAAGCFRSSPADGSLKCSGNAARPCPKQFYCAADGTCWRIGHAPVLAGDGGPLGMDAGGTDDAGGADDAGLTGDGGATLLPLGAPCTRAAACASGHCTDGACCDDECAGQCQACNLEGKVGTCSTVTTGPPHGARPACAGAETTCGGQCNGGSPTSCTYPAAQTGCGATCDGVCDGAGHCSSNSTGSCPGGFSCGVGGCRTQCTVDGDCQPWFSCTPPTCTRLPEGDCLDGLDNNGDGLSDCQDPTCADRVTCVPNGPPGDTVGVFAADACPLNYNTPNPEHQGLSAPGCDGCYCRALQTCSVTVYFDTTSCTPGGPTVSLTSTGSSDFAAITDDCTTVADLSPVSVDVSAATLGAGACTAVGTAYLPDKKWAVTRSFCAAERSSTTCGSNQICVAKPQPGAAICLRIPGAAQPCPSGFQGGSATTWYGDVSDNRTCTGCSCGSPTSTGNCSGSYIVTGTSPSACPVPTFGGSVGSAACGTVPTPIGAVVLTAAYVQFPGCNLSYNSGGSFGTIDPATICCPTCSCASSPCISLACPSGNYCDGAACKTCDQPKLCGSDCVDCTAMKADTCTGGTMCTCGGVACDAARADNCTNSMCQCGNLPQCTVDQASQCVAGVCKCGNNAACDGVLGLCTGTSCRCGSSAPCDPKVSNHCVSGVCRCGNGSKCNLLTADNCTSGTCKCGTGNACNQFYARCMSGSCMCGASLPCTGGKICTVVGGILGCH